MIKITNIVALLLLAALARADLFATR